jgi:putative hydrolase of the HAD superfamily
MAEPQLDPTRLEAVIFDVDGTLYSQASLRRAMARRLVRAYLTRPFLGVRTFRVLEAYRKAQEHLRDAAEGPYHDLAEVQLRLACERSGSKREFVGVCVERWMEQEPLALLAARIRPGLMEFVQACRAWRLKLGVLSDYPAETKLNALGLGDVFDVVVAAQSRDIGVFKPDPRGLLVIAERLGVRPAACVYVGDRMGIDDVAAACAGMTSILVGDEFGYPELSRALAQPILDLH